MKVEDFQVFNCDDDNDDYKNNFVKSKCSSNCITHGYFPDDGLFPVNCI